MKLDSKLSVGVCSTDNVLPPIFSTYLQSFEQVTSGKGYSGASSQQKMRLYIYIYFLGIFLFLIKRIVFLSVSFLYLMKYRISVTEYYLTETGVGDKKLLVELCGSERQQPSRKSFQELNQ